MSIDSYGGYKVCRECGKVFYVLRPELWAYKKKIETKQEKTMAYFHTYSCKKSFEEKYNAQKVDGRTTCHLKQQKKKYKRICDGKSCDECRYFVKGKYGFYECSTSSVTVKPGKRACNRFKPMYEGQANDT
jgi:hypothetical protein